MKIVEFVSINVEGLRLKVMGRNRAVGMKPSERVSLAKRAGINPESLRVMQRRKTLNADTLIRLLMARGLSLQPQPTDSSRMQQGEIDWQKLGLELGDAERVEYTALVRFVHKKWVLAKAKANS